MSNITLAEEYMLSGVEATVLIECSAVFALAF